MKLWNKYHREKFGESWITDSGLSFTEDVLHTALDMERRKGKLPNPKEYIEKLFSIADNLSEKVEKAGGTEDAAKETIKRFIAHKNIPYKRDINFVDILNNLDDKKNRGADCLGKTILFACLAEMINHKLFSKLKCVTLPDHIFIRIKSPEGDRDIETTITYRKMERKSEGIGIERKIKFLISAELNRFYCEANDEKILDEILDKYPTNDVAWFNKALACAKRNDLSKAEEYINRALEIFPDEPDYLILKGYIEYEKGNKRVAREYYEKAMLSKYADKNIKKECLEDIVKIDRELNSNMHA